MAQSSLLSSSIGKKVIMSLSGFFLISFILIHLSINLLSVLPSPDAFNAASHFMGSNWFIQAMQLVLGVGFLLHIVLGIILTLKNSKARPIKYASYKPGKSSSYASRYMIWTGIMVLAFLVLHLKDFFIPVKKGIENYGFESDFELVQALFASPVYTLIYVFAFILLGIHLYHGFQSAFQSIGLKSGKYGILINKLSTAFCLLTVIGFSAIAIKHFITSLS